MTEDDLRELQNYLLEHPEIAPVIQGTGGVRKLRWAREGRGNPGACGRSISICGRPA